MMHSPPHGSERNIQTKAVRDYTQNQQPPAPENLPRRTERTHENTEPRNTHPPENYGKGNKGPTKSTLTTCELIQLQAIRYTYYKKPEPVHTLILPINTSRVIRYNTITMTFVTISNYNKVENIYVKNM